MSGWTIERPLADGRIAYDIGYRIDGRCVRRKGGDSRTAAKTELEITVGDIARGRIRGHATDDLATYARK